MINAQVLKLLTEADCSPEELAEVIGCSGMTIRRWLKKPKQEVPRVYLPAIREACYALIAKGRLGAESPSVRDLVALAPSSEHDAAVQALGLPDGFPMRGAMSQDTMLGGLAHIGMQERKQHEVNRGRKKMLSFGKLGAEWSRRIEALWRIVRSDKLGKLDKTVAYGALFYLLSPIDLIPDHIPFFGLLDDFGVLGLALAYYNSRFRDLA